MKQLSLENLRTFVTIVDMEGFARAGDILGRSQPAVSLQIKKLEEQLGTRLFQKRGQRQVVNHAGQKLYDMAVPMLQQNDQIFQFFTEKPVSGKIRLGIPSEFATQVLPPIIGAFNAIYPDVTLEVTSSLSTSLTQKHRGKPFDLLLTVITDLPAELDGSVLTDKLVWVGSTKHSPCVDPVDLVVAPEGCRYRERVLKSLKACHTQSHIRYTISDITGITAAINEGLGITALAQSTVPDSLEVLTHPDLPDLGDMAIRISSEDSANPEAVAKLSEFISSRLAVNLLQ